MKKFFLVATLALAALCAQSQTQPPKKVYFVDGYHGGVYGHYPIEWNTRFMVDEFEEHPEWRIGLEIEPETWDTVKLYTPVDYENFRRITTDRRVEFTNPAYAQPYCYNVSGESIIRQFEYGIKKTRSHFPGVEFVTYSVEEPCFTSSLPQILSQFGFRYAVLKNPNTCWGGYMAPYGGQLVNWIGPDGTSLLTVPRYAAEELEDNSVWQTKAWGNEEAYLAACFAAGIEAPVGMTYQDAGWKGGPWIGSGDKIRNNSIYVTWREYMEEVTDGKTGDNYRMSQEDVRPALMWGSQVLQKIARQVRTTENRIVTAEKMGAIASLAGKGYNYSQSGIDEAWRTLMLAQHHDSWIVPYNSLHRKGTWADAIGRWTAAADDIADGVVAGAGSALATGNGDADGGYLTVFNTSAAARTETVSVELPRKFAGKEIGVMDAAGKRVAAYTDISDGKTRLVVRAKVPPFGYSTYRILPDESAAITKMGVGDFAEDEFVLENSEYRIVVDTSKGGIIKSLVAKREGGREFAADGQYALGELRGHFYDEGVFHSSTETPATVKVLADNPLEKSILVSGHIAGHPFIQQITIREGERRIDFTLDVDWQGSPGIGEYRQEDAARSNRRAFYDDRFKLNVMLPVALFSPALYKDAPFDVCESTLEDTFFNTWDNIKHNVILHWVDLAERDGRGGFALLSDHTTSYSYGSGFPLALTVQFSGNGLWGRDYNITGPSRVKFAVIPHSGVWDAAGVQQESTHWNEPLVCLLHDSATPGERSLVDVTGSGYEISAAYPVEEGILVRLYNADGDGAARTVKFGFPVTAVREVDLNGDATRQLKVRKRSGGGETEISMPRFGIRTLIVTKQS